MGGDGAETSAARILGDVRGPVFLVGCPRSGTSLLQRMLDAHPDVAIAPETFFVRRFWLRRRESAGEAGYLGLAAMARAIVETDEFRLMALDAAGFLDAAASCVADAPGLFALLLKLFAEARGALVVGEKTPNHLLYMRELEWLFPSCLFIHLVRDPRAVVNSWRSVPWSTGTIRGDAEVWRRYLSTSRLKRPRDEAILTVRYEVLVREPNEELARICRFLKIDFCGDMLEFHKSEPKAIDPEREPWKTGVLEPLNDRAVDKWRSALTADEVSEIECHVWPEMVRWGYAPTLSLPRLVPRALWLGMKRALRQVKRRVSGEAE